MKDPSGLASYSGEVELTSVGRFVAGGAYLSGKMHTECINGKRFVGNVRAVFAGAAVGIPVADTIFDLTVSDNASGYGNLNNLSGLASMTALSGAAGPWGGAVSQVVLGQAQTTFPLGTQVGIDLSATAMGGWSFVSNVHEESCCP
jgi:hypothetical protein